MALTDAYATVDEYRARVNSTTSDDDATIEAQLKGVSRMIDRWCARFFNKDSSVQTRVYDGGPGLTTFAMLMKDVSPSPVGGKTRLYLPDDIASTTGLVVAVDLDGDSVVETTLTLNTDYWVGPPNAALGPEPWPYQYLDVVPNNPTGMTTWPTHRRSVSVTALYGWPAVPQGVKDCCVMFTRELRDLQESGMTQAISAIDSEVRLVDRSPKMRERIIQQYGRGRKTFV